MRQAVASEASSARMYCAGNLLCEIDRNPAGPQPLGKVKNVCVPSRNVVAKLWQQPSEATWGRPLIREQCEEVPN